jgi:FHS family L-fucose permease-like MFS transporter
LLGSYFILSGANSHVNGDLTSVKSLYLAIGSVILIIAVAFSFVNVPELQDVHGAPAPAETGYSSTAEEVPQAKGLFGHSHFRWAWLSQFLNVAAQGGTWAFFINYGVEKMHFTDKVAGGYFSIFMVIGRWARWSTSSTPTLSSSAWAWAILTVSTPKA